jgi:hypothetical protein
MTEKNPTVTEVTQVTTADQAAPATTPEAARREVLKRLGVYGAFVTPALLTAFSSSASAQAVTESGATN